MAKKKTTRRTKPKKPTATAKAKANVKGALAGAVEAVAKRLPGTDTDALTLLETDHRRLEELLAQAEDTTETAVKTRRALPAAALGSST